MLGEGNQAVESSWPNGDIVAALGGSRLAKNESGFLAGGTKPRSSRQEQALSSAPSFRQCAIAIGVEATSGMNHGGRSHPLIDQEVREGAGIADAPVFSQSRSRPKRRRGHNSHGPHPDRAARDEDAGHDHRTRDDHNNDALILRHPGLQTLREGLTGPRI